MKPTFKVLCLNFKLINDTHFLTNINYNFFDTRAKLNYRPVLKINVTKNYWFKIVRNFNSQCSHDAR